MRKYFSSIIVIILCFAGSYRMIIPQSCVGMPDGFNLMAFAFILIVFILILLCYNLYKKVILKKSFNFTPFITLIIVLSIISLIKYFQSENFKSDKIIEAKNSHYHFLARLDYTYELRKKEVECTCIEQGSYIIKQDTLFLTKNPGINITNYQNEIFLIDKLQGFLIPIYKDSLVTDKTSFLVLQKI